MKIITIIGARPQFIKAAAVSKKIREKNQEIIIHTGQHYDENMSKVFFEELNIPYPDYNLNVGSGDHGAQTGRMLEKIEEILLKENPDCVLVYGDTNSTIAGSLAASKLLIPVSHVEAGLRSFNMNMPEEQNRILTDHISRYLFAPTATAVENLNNEGLKNNVFNVGDVMFDAILHFENIAKNKSSILKELNLKNKEYILATIHRAENTNDINRMKSIVEALNESGEKIVLPLHPRTKKYIKEYNLKFSSNIKIIDPIGYLDMIMLEANSKKIVSDSGGVQKEAFFMDVPCITLRDETEWIETVKNGWNILVGADKQKIKNAILSFAPTNKKLDYFGNGKAADKIIDILEKNI
ncbi:UDP-N-acetylglucosamine 2-epimerase (non-hydrolyzing) [Clostridium aestuarii]|uniref:UDP-N-acetylglucosamine 2-epimerase (Non-hydrolyzing) n=1 Tax=Clostridium aestuarii TaxID=338193 RepID=A0ABT4CX55_9CLOT|nr:UDP-N-acetylglucosamine 2-epimerase (non-hydrolyzing) [Clostridium aestuarii]MCY6483573.1 UDP-N-acetylglucosamine 2-epimerase (non-hydrolyzing) [Clostridium aestuarii]